MTGNVTFPLAVVFQAIDRLTGPLGTMSAGLSGFGRMATQLGRQLTFGITTPVLGVGGAAVSMGIGFEAGMNRVEAVLGGKALGHMQALRDQARELGETTEHSARAAAAGMGFLAQAGFDAQQIIAAMPGTLSLASAAQLDLARAADISSNILTGYGFEVGKIGRVVDVLAATSSSANTDVEQLGEGLKKAGPIAASMKIPFEETVAVFGRLGDASIQGSLAGTAVLNMMTRLANPTGEAVAALNGLRIRKEDVLDSEGNVKSLIGVLDLLRDRGAGTTEMIQIFGKMAGPSIAALLLQSEDSVRSLRDELELASGTAQQMATTQMQGAPGAVAELRSATEGLLIAIADSGLLEHLASVANLLTGWFQGLSRTNPWVLRLGTYIAMAAAVLGPLAIGLGAAANGLSIMALLAAKSAGSLIFLVGKGAGAVAWTMKFIEVLAVWRTAIMAKVVPAIWSMTGALLANPITWIVALVAGLVFGLYKLAKSNTIVGKAMRDTWDWIAKGVSSAISWIGDLLDSLWDSLPDWLTGLFGSSGSSDVRVTVGGNAEDLLPAGGDPNLSPSTAFLEGGSVSRSESTVKLDLSGLPEGARVGTEGDLDGVDIELGPVMSGGL